MQILMITCEWPTDKKPYSVPFIVDQVNLLIKCGIEVEVFHFNGFKNPLNYFNAWRIFQNKIKHKKYDLVHAQWGQSGIITLFPKRLPLVVTFRGDDVQGISNKFGKNTLLGKVLQNITKFVAIHADEAIVVSDHMIQKLPRRKYFVIPSGIDLNLFKPMNRNDARMMLNLDQNSPIIFFGGNPDIPNKRYKLALSAFELVKRNIPNSQFIVAKNIPHSLIPVYLNACNLLLLTSSHEGSPNVIKEALACNVPVVCTDAGDARKRVSLVDGCILCTDDQPETISESILEVIRVDKIINGRETVVDLDISLLTKEIIEVYKLAIQNNHKNLLTIIRRSQIL